jgi:endonuclease/exonuclease/phosphatase (EEP) superfamily protein YafD
MPNLVRNGLRLGRVCAWGLLMVGLILQFWVRDRLDSLAPYFYALPLPILVGLCVWLSLRSSRRWVPLGLAVILTGIWMGRSWQRHEVPAVAGAVAEHEFRVLFWNMSRPTVLSAALIEMIKELQPDIVGCVEPGPNAASQLSAYDAALPGYRADFMPRGLLWITRCADRRRERGKLDNLGAFTVWEVTHEAQTVRTVLVDVYANPWLTRRRQLAETLALAQAEPLAVVMGDFNTPLESVHLRPFREKMTNAFEAAGNGLRETWFWGLPILSLDQVWVGPGWKVLEAKKLQSRESDHAAMFVRLVPGLVPGLNPP